MNKHDDIDSAYRWTIIGLTVAAIGSALTAIGTILKLCGY